MVDSDKAAPLPQKSHDALLQAMPEATRKVAIALKQRQMDISRSVVLLRHEAGTQLVPVLKQPSKYGVEAAQQIATYLGLGQKGVATLTEWKNFSEVFSREYVKHQLSQPKQDGTPLDYTHFILIMRVKGEKERTALFERVRNENLTTRALEEITHTEHVIRKPQTDRPGRSQTKPVSVAAGLKMTRDRLFTVVNFFEKTFDAVILPEMAEMPPTEITEQHLALLEAVKDYLTQVVTMAEKAQRDIVPAEERVRTVLVKAGKLQLDDRSEEETQERSQAFQEHVQTFATEEPPREFEQAATGTAKRTRVRRPASSH